MKRAISDLQIHIHKIDGSTTGFVQPDVSEAHKLLDGFQPAEMFNRGRFVLTDRDSITSLPVSKITRIDLISELLPHLVFPVGIVNAVELTGTQFQELVRNPVMRKQWEEMSVEGASVVTFMDLQMADGQRLFLTREAPAEQLQADLLDANGFSVADSSLCFRTLAGGVAVLNLAHLVRLTFFPKPPHPPAEAWPLQLFHGSQSAAENAARHAGAQGVSDRWAALLAAH